MLARRRGSFRRRCVAGPAINPGGATSKETHESMEASARFTSTVQHASHALRAKGKAQAPSEPLVQLTTRVPRQLRQSVRLHCVQADRLMQDFVTEALRESLRRRQGR